MAFSDLFEKVRLSGAYVEPLANDTYCLGSPTYGFKALHAVGNLETVANKGKHLIAAYEGGSALERHQTYYWDGGAYAATNGYGFGNYALSNNTGADSNGFGYAALQNNTGADSNGFGYAALSNNTGVDSNGFGYAALSNNTGVYSNGFGHAALYNNTGVYSNGFGHAALYNNTGADSNGFGNAALQNNNWGNVIRLGYDSEVYFLSNFNSRKTFTDAEVNGTLHTITIGDGHGFGSSEKVNLKFTSTAGTPPTGLTTATVYQFTVTSSTVLTLASITSAGSADFEGYLENSVDNNNSIGIGTDCNATAPNSVRLGNSSVTFGVLGGKTIAMLAAAASNTLMNSSDTAKSTTALTYTKIKEIRINEPLTGVRIKFDLKTAGGGATAYAKIYKNGVAVGTEQTDVTGGYVTKSEDLTTFALGDLIQVYAYTSDGAQAAYVQNFRFYYDLAVILTTAISAVNQDP